MADLEHLIVITERLEAKTEANQEKMDIIQEVMEAS
jgi:hypothetical protein